MGCTSSSESNAQQQILPLPRQIVNSYIDRVSIVMINKIKDKYESQLSNNQNQMKYFQFIIMFKNCPISDIRKKNLYDYFNNNRKKYLPLNKFIQKYCILIKSTQTHFSQIIHKIFCKNIETDKMSKQDFDDFQIQCANYFNKTYKSLSTQKFPVLWTQFFNFTKDLINWQELQNSFQIVSIDELPFKAFHQQYQKFVLSNLNPGQNYYIVSAQWFSQWIFYYQYQDTDIRNSSFRLSGTDKIKRKQSFSKRKKHSKSIKAYSSKLISNQNSRCLQILQPPTQINMSQIKGEYFSQLKPYLLVQRDITIINQKMWSILKSTLGSQIQFRREAIDDQNVELYPASIYFYQIDKYSEIENDSLKIFPTNKKTNLNQFNNLISNFSKKVQNNHQLSQIQEKCFYYKQFGSQNFKNFIQWEPTKTLQQIMQQQNTKIIIVQIPIQKKYSFQNLYKRDSLTLSNITVGDRILAYFSYQDKYINAEIINIGLDKNDKSKKQYKVHFKGFSYTYQRYVKASQIKLLDTTTQNEIDNKNEQKSKQKLFQGLINIGNTCFINSTIQSLVSTSIFDKFYLKANLSQKKYPLNYGLSKVVKGLLKKQQFNIYDFKKIINNKLPLFSGYDQHDAQQFLNLLLDKIDQQLVQKPNIIDQLFGGKMQSKFKCLKCKQQKTKQQKIHTISLPIPQSEYNYFVIMVFPVYLLNVRKIVLRLHKNAKINQYLAQIQNRTNINRYDLVYVECQYSMLKKFRNQILFQTNEDKKVIQLGLSSDIQIWAYQKIRNTSIQYRLKLKQQNTKLIKQKLQQNHYYDYYSNQENCWGITKIQKIKDKQIILSFIKDNNLKQIIIQKKNTQEDNQQIQKQFYYLGTKINQKIYRKVYLRKFSKQAQKMVAFDFQLLIGLPKWVSYNDTLIFVDQYLQGLNKNKRKAFLKSNKTSIHTSRAQSIQDLDENDGLNQDQLRLTSLNSTFVEQKVQPYIVHFVQPQKNCCFFCQKQLQPVHNIQQIKKCCQPQQKNIPLYWSGKQRNFYVNIDWIQLQQYNSSYCNDIKIDNLSISAQQKMLDQRITLKQCLDLWKKPQVVELQCQKCKHNQHLLQINISKTPIITIFHLKQFRYTQQGHFIKLNVNLQWNQSINLQKYCKNNSKSVYQMFSVIQHKGSTSSGHYTTLTKRRHPIQKSKVWINFDDQGVEVIQKIPQNIKNAYLLFFKKVDMPSSAVVHFSI